MEQQVQSQGQTKKCPKCSEEIQASAKVCKHCQSDLRSSFAKHKILTGFLILIIIVIFSSVINSYNKTQDTMGDIGKTVADNEKQLDKYQAIVDSASNKKAEPVYKISNSIKLGGAIITVNKVETSNGGAYLKPQTGNQFVNLNITVENTEASEQYVTTMGQMFLRDSDGNSYQVAVTDKAMESVNNHLDGTIIAKSKRTGWVGFEIKKEAKNIQFQYNGSMWGGDNIVVDLNM
ncbi:MAG: DUF4352 domain-containing protein [Candidatus Moranbacteria bacterium]|nr:DUF4352 domain-containing protein [Candidatus Moranbacteria bacterium]